MNQKKNYLSIILRIFACVVISQGLTTAIRVIVGIFKGSHGAPDFLTVPFVIYMISSNVLFVIGYLLIGFRIPVHNRFLKGILFSAMFLISDFYLQILGLYGGDSPLLSTSAFGIGTTIIDSIGYLVEGFLFGVFFYQESEVHMERCKIKNLVIASIVSAFVFAGELVLIEIVLGNVNHNLYSYTLFQVSNERKIPYYVLFYSCQYFSGACFPIIYRFTEFNSMHTHKWLIFAAVYGLLLWGPVVLIMAFFGTPVLPTVLYTILYVGAIFGVSALYPYFIKGNQEMSSCTIET